MEAANEFVNDAILEDKLIDLWTEYPCLYDASSTDFKNRDRRDIAWNTIATNLDKSVEWVKKKLQTLRNSYSKAKKTQSSGSARKSLGKRTIWLLDKLQFLAPYIATRKSVSNLNLESPATAIGVDQNSSIEADDITLQLTDDEDDTSFLEDTAELPKQTHLTDDGDNETKGKSTKEPLKGKRKLPAKKLAEQEDELIKCLSQSIAERKNKRQRNSNDAFSCWVSETLSGLDNKMRYLAQHKISDILFQAQGGTLSKIDQAPQPQNNISQLPSHNFLLAKQTQQPFPYSVQHNSLPNYQMINRNQSDQFVYPEWSGNLAPHKSQTPVIGQQQDQTVTLTPPTLLLISVTGPHQIHLLSLPLSKPSQTHVTGHHPIQIEIPLRLTI